MTPTPPDGGPTREETAATDEIRLAMIGINEARSVQVHAIIMKHFAPLRARQTELEKCGENLATAIGLLLAKTEGRITDEAGKVEADARLAREQFRTLTAREGK
ncbi:MAG: hypothetical protein JSR30_00215 [Proteobacteria bacterium]|nr:hypothetical protein [Pseudomonadota bacterium]